MVKMLEVQSFFKTMENLIKRLEETRAGLSTNTTDRIQNEYNKIRIDTLTVQINKLKSNG